MKQKNVTFSCENQAKENDEYVRHVDVKQQDCTCIHFGKGHQQEDKISPSTDDRVIFTVP